VCGDARSFFWTRLACTPAGFDYKGVRRWTKHVDVFSHKLLLVPINHNNTHWCLAVVDVEQRTIEYFDSMHGGGLSGSGGAKRVLAGLERYLGEEAKDKGRDRKAGKRWQHKVQPSAMRGLISCIGSPSGSAAARAGLAQSRWLVGVVTEGDAGVHGGAGASQGDDSAAERWE